jgi:hypothetical protein
VRGCVSDLYVGLCDRLSVRASLRARLLLFIIIIIRVSAYTEERRKNMCVNARIM